MNVLLIYPEFPDTFWSMKHALKFIRKKASLPPLGLLTVAALLPEAWPKRLVDLNVNKLSKKDLAWADCAFIGAMLVQKDSARKVIALCRSAGVLVVAGGPLFTSEFEKFGDVDHFVLNEAELTLPEFLADIEQGRPRRVYSTTGFADIMKTPAPLWELASLRHYAAVSIQYSRGCPFHCEFCNVTALFGHRARTKSAAQFIEELDNLHGQGWRGNVFVVDDNFIGNSRLLKAELLPALIEWQRRKGGITFFTEVSINLADDEHLVEMMVEAGFEMVFIGIETPNEASLAESKKAQNQKRDLIGDVKFLQRAGLQVQGGFIVGFDNDTPSIFQKQIEFIQKSGIVTAMVGLLQALPGTKLYERLKQQGRLRSEASGDNVTGTTNIVPAMGINQLIQGYQTILRNIYAPEHYYRRLKTFLREYRLPKIQARLDFQRKLAFIRAMIYLGIIGQERFHYWKVLLWTLFKNPRLIPTMVTLAIYGYHFRKVCERTFPK